MPKTKDKEQGFEESLSSLEKIVAQLESGDLPLERALDLFEEGIVLARRCQAQLEDAEQKVEVLLRERGTIKTLPFESKSEPSVNQTKPDVSPTSMSSLSLSSAVRDGTIASELQVTDDVIPF